MSTNASMLLNDYEKEMERFCYDERKNIPIFMTKKQWKIQLAKSAMDASYTEEIRYHGEPVLVVIEGLTVYLKEKDVKQIFHIIHEKFETAIVYVETMSPLVASYIKEKSIQGSQAKFTWGVKSGKELQKLIPEFINRR